MLLTNHEEKGKTCTEMSSSKIKKNNILGKIIIKLQNTAHFQNQTNSSWLFYSEDNL